MLKRRIFFSKALSITIFAAVVLFSVFLQFLSPCLYEVDGYYNVAVANFIKESGLHFKFHWAQFSTFKDSYGDTELLYHLSIIPFLYVTKDMVLAGKLCVIFYNMLFFLTLAVVLKKYIPDIPAALFLALPILSPAFVFYFLRLRAVTLAVILTILCVYCLINKRCRALFILSVIYALSHPSFPTIILFAVFCEVIRRFSEKEFFIKNIYAVAGGALVGCVINPYFPNNMFNIFLNGIMVPIYSIIDKGIIFGREVYTQPAGMIFMTNFLVFSTIIIVLWLAFIERAKASFGTMVWWASAGFYFLISFRSDRFWYPTNALFFIFLASFLKDCMELRRWSPPPGMIKSLIGVYSAIILVCLPYTIQLTRSTIAYDALNNLHFERVGIWMRENLPKGERVYHAYGSDASYFLCLDPDNDYLVLCDPIYMFWRYPEEYKIYLKLRQAEIGDPSAVIYNVFGARFGYTSRSLPLYRQVKNSPDRFSVIYEDQIGVLFKIAGIDNSIHRIGG